jgi:hypothetical protein
VLLAAGCLAEARPDPAWQPAGESAVQVLDGDELGEAKASALALRAPVQQVLSSNLKDGPKPKAPPKEKTHVLPSQALARDSAAVQAAETEARMATTAAKVDATEVSTLKSRERNRKKAQPQPPSEKEQAMARKQKQVEAEAARQVRSHRGSDELQRKHAEFERSRAPKHTMLGEGITPNGMAPSEVHRLEVKALAGKDHTADAAKTSAEVSASDTSSPQWSTPEYDEKEKRVQPTSEGPVTAKELAHDDVLIAKLKSGKVKDEAEAVEQHLKEDRDEIHEGTLPRKLALDELSADGKRLISVAEGLEKQGSNQHQEKVILALSTAVGEEKNALHKMKKKASPAAESTLQGSKPNQVASDVQAAKLGIATDRKLRNDQAQASLQRLNSINTLLAGDLQRVGKMMPSGEKKSEEGQLEKSTQAVAAEAQEVQREMDSLKHRAPAHIKPQKASTEDKENDAEKKKVSTAPISKPKKTPETFEHKMEAIQSKADHFVDSEVQKVKKVTKDNDKAIKEDADTFASRVRRTAALKIEMAKLKKADKQIAAKEESVAHTLVTKPVSLLEIGESAEPADLSLHHKTHAELKGSTAALNVVSEAIAKQAGCKEGSKAEGCEPSMKQAIEKAKLKANKASAKIARDTMEKASTDAPSALKKKLQQMKMNQAVESLEASEEAMNEEASKAAKDAQHTLKKTREMDAADETRLNEAKFIMDYVKKAQADAERMKIVNPVAGAIEAAKRQVEMAQVQNRVDVSKAQHAAAASSALIAKHGSPGQIRHTNKVYHQMQALSHLSRMDVYDARDKLSAHKRTFNALQARLEAKKAKMIKQAVKKAEKEGLKVWREKLAAATGAKPSSEAVAVAAAKKEDKAEDAKFHVAAEKRVGEELRQEEAAAEGQKAEKKDAKELEKEQNDGTPTKKEK